MFMVMCVVDDPAKLDAVLDAWKKAGTGGVTVIESTGFHRLRTIPAVPMRYTFGPTRSERGNYSLFSVVENEAMIQLCLEATESVLGSLSNPNTGIFTAWPLTVAAGVSGKNKAVGGSK